MSYWSTRGLRGSNLEDMINRTNRAYLDDNLAVIQKIPTSITPVRLDNQRGVISLAYFDEKSTVDYVGNVQGIPLCFDAKETSKPSLPLENIHEHQIEFMKKFEEQRGLAFILVYFKKYEKFFLMDIQSVNKFYENALNGGRKSIPYNAFDERLEIFKNKDGYMLHYLDTINIYLNLCKKEI